MLKQELPTISPEKIELEKIEVKEFSGEFINEVSEGVESFLTIVTVCEISFLLIVTIALLFTSPLVSPVGIGFITHLIRHYRKKLRELRDESEE
jgi:hypothetical protein